MGCTLPGGKSMMLDNASGAGGGSAVFGIRPEHMELASEGELSGRITLVEKLGSETMVHADIGAEAPIIVKADGLTGAKIVMPLPSASISAPAICSRTKVRCCGAARFSDTKTAGRSSPPHRNRRIAPSVAGPLLARRLMTKKS